MKKLFILTLAVLSFAACNQAAKQPVQGNAVEILPIESYNFTEKINQKPVVVAFMAGYCGYCKMMLPYMDELAGQVPSSQADVIAAFMDDSPSTLVDLEPVKATKNIQIYYGARPFMDEYGVTGFPTIMLFKDGQQVETWRGYSPNHVADILETLNDLK